MDPKTDSPTAFTTETGLEALRGQIQSLEETIYRLLDMMKSLPEGELRNGLVAETSTLYVISNGMRQLLNSGPGQESGLANSRAADEGPAGAVPNTKEFDKRLEDLRGAIKSKSSSESRVNSKPSSADRANIVSARIRRVGWVFGALVFIGVLLIRWNGQIADLPGIIFIAILVSAVCVCLAELAILAARKFVL